MKVIIFLSFIFLAHSYEPSQIKINKLQYQRYVIPQLRSINQNFSKMIELIHPELKIHQFLELLSELPEQTNNISSCLGQSRCSTNLQKILSTWGQIGVELTNELDEAKIVKSRNYAHRKVLLEQNWRKIRLQLRAQELALLSKVKKNRDLSPVLIPDLERFYQQASLWAISTLPEITSEAFNLFWAQFIEPTNQLLSDSNSLGEFKKRLSKLNSSWNFLELQLTKRKVTLNDQAKSLVNTLHNRWNRVLKVAIAR